MVAWADIFGMCRATAQNKVIVRDIVGISAQQADQTTFIQHSKKPDFDDLSATISTSTACSENDLDLREFEVDWEVPDEATIHLKPSRLPGPATERSAVPESPQKLRGNEDSEVATIQHRRQMIRDKKQARVYECLRSHGFDGINEPRRGGQETFYPLHFAALGGCLGLVRELLKLGADPHQKTSRGRTALDVAIDADNCGSHRMVVEFLSGAWHVTNVRDLVKKSSF
mmetsp:Transcript_28174/g.58089  ORF Transcript_28174/g.58089 Transcript_28174/m.58089 type:complete len:228 (-) Transcript_28174:53-736(-)